MVLYNGWLLRADAKDIEIVTSEFSFADIVRLLDSTELICKSFATPDGSYNVWLNNDPKRQFLYNETAQHILDCIRSQWSTYHGNILVTYTAPLNNRNEPAVVQNMPTITLTEFVDACNRSLEKA
jgi:hypothetical protein